VVHSRDEGVEAAHTSPKNQSQFSQMMMGQVKPSFQIDPKHLPTSCYRFFITIYSVFNGIFYRLTWLTNQLQDQRNLIMAKATGFAWFFHHFSLRGAFWPTAVHTMYSSWTYRCPPLFAIHLWWQWKVSIWWWHVMASFHNGNCGYFSFDYKGDILLRTFIIK